MDDETTLLIKFSKTVLFLSLPLASMSVRQLKEQVLSVLRTSKQPTDDVLGKPFSDATPDDLELYVAREDAYVPLAAQAESSQRADDGTPLCMHCHLEEGMAVYVGFRAPEQGM
ncbi:hypothetical protein ACI68E_002683 [Malassezia pachydermatis]